MTVDGDASQLADFPGVHDFVQRRDQVTFSADACEINGILAAVSRLGVKGFEAVPPTLEDLFMRHYER